MARAKTKMTESKGVGPKLRLNTVKPSGKKEESLVGLIYDVVRQIPKGRVTSYGAISSVLSLPNPRMVGRAMGLMDETGKPVPAQRVVNSTGHVTGDHKDHRKKLLEKEGVKLKGDKIIDFKTLFWDPAKEL
jgi:methylated-DNA-protein-cysteine methyltransferase-like protein